MAKDLKAILKDNLNAPGLVGDLMDEMLKPALDKVVADTSNSLDDALMMALYPTLSAALKVEAAKQWEKLLGTAVQPVVAGE